VQPVPNRTPKQTRALERVAKKIYDESNTTTKPWLRLGWDVREAWLDKAEAMLGAASSPFEWLYFWRSGRLYGGPNSPNRR
jgi:hypothetical protein